MLVPLPLLVMRVVAKAVVVVLSPIGGSRQARLSLGRFFTGVACAATY